MNIDASVRVGSGFLSGLREALLIFEKIERSSDRDNVCLLYTSDAADE